MFGLAIRKHERDQALKQRILRNREGVLDAMGEVIKGARQCPYLLGQKCIGNLCEHFVKYTATDKEGRQVVYWRCVHTQMPKLMIELISEIRELKEILKGGNDKGI